MQIYFKQSLGCFYANARDPNYKAYGYYDKGERLVANHHACTYEQINQGAGIQYAILVCIIALVCGLLDRHLRVQDRIGMWGSIFASVFGGFLLFGILLIGLGALWEILVIALGLLPVVALFYIGKYASTPLQYWKQYQMKKKRAVETRLRETQAEINRLRTSDPRLNEALKSLDAMTTALLD